MKEMFVDTGFLFKRSWLVFIRHFQSFSLAGIIFLGSFFVWLFCLSLVGMILVSALGVNSRSWSLIEPVVKMIFVLGFSLWGLFYNAVVIKLVACASSGESINLLDLFRQVKLIFASFLLVSCLVFVKVFLWSLLLIIPGIIFSCFYVFSQFGVVLEGKKGKEALIISRGLIQPNLGDFMFKYISMFVLVLGIYFVVRLCLGVVPLAGVIVSFFVHLFLSMYLTIFIYHLYLDYKHKDLAKDRTSLESVVLEQV